MKLKKKTYICTCVFCNVTNILGNDYETLEHYVLNSIRVLPLCTLTRHDHNVYAESTNLNDPTNLTE